MTFISIPLFLTLLILLSPSKCLQQANASTRQALEIIIGIGGGSSPPGPSPEPECPPPRVDPLMQAKRVIERFRKTIACDPSHITRTWNGSLCYDKNVYKGFVCARKPGETRLSLAGVNFNGANLCGKKQFLDTNGFIDKLSSDLVFFHVNSNNFSGGIPAAIAANKIPFFYELDLSNNKLSSTFPTAVLTATNLTFLDLRFNSLYGPLPPQVFKLDLDVLFLNNNQFSGEIPDNLGKTPVLYLTLANNLFTGPIPSSIGEAAKTLVEVLFLGNQLSGCLPYQIGKLKKATVFDASKNNLRGPIPLSFGCLNRMQLLNLASNQLSGTVPECLCKIKSLVKLTLRDNYFTQVGPECWKLIARGILDVNKNCIPDLPNQRWEADCAEFFSKHTPCPDPKSMLYVPCTLPPSQESKEEEGSLPAPAAAPSRAYAALEIPPP